MLSFDRLSADLIEVKARGTITQDQVRDFYTDLWPAIADAKRLGMVLDLSEFKDITGRAVMEDLWHELSALPEIRRFPKVAIITDKAWLRAAERMIDPIVPFVDMACFDPTDTDGARAFASSFLSEEAEDAARKGKGARMIDSPLEGVLAFEVDGYMTDAQGTEIAQAFRAKLAEDTPFDALARIKRFSGFDPGILVQREFIQMKFDAARKLRRYAIVTDERWVKPMMGLARALTNVEIEIFAEDQEQAAWDWLSGKDAA